MRKLGLKRETVSMLDEEMLSQVYGADGGTGTQDTCTCCPWSTPSCYDKCIGSHEVE